MKDKWNLRYADDEYAYGELPNAFLKEIIDQQKTIGKILFPAEGEGRNAVYAAKLGWNTFAFDISENGRMKAEKLAQKNNVKLNYQVGAYFELPLIKEQFDAAALIYAHFPPPILASYYQKTGDLIKPGGIIIIEGFSKGHLPYRLSNPAVGGPDQLDFLLSIQEIKGLFSNFGVLQLEETEIQLNEGLYHQGIGKVIRFVGKKNA